MSLSTAEKQTIIKEYGLKEGDTGSPETQVALLTTRIKTLTEHLKSFKQDQHSRTGLLKLVSRRRRLLDYLKRESFDRYQKLCNSLGLRR